MKLSKRTYRKFIESYPGNGRKILTPSGFKEILEVHKTIKYRKFQIELENGYTINCAYNHVLIDKDYNEIYAKDSLNSFLITDKGESKVIKVTDTGLDEHMFDISINSKDELYFSNGILSHNSGKSITTSIYLAYKYNFSSDFNIGIVGNKGGQAREFLANTKNIIIELPIWMQQGTNTWNKGSIENESGMRILTDVPTSDAFRGFTIALLVVDEAAFIRSSRWEEFEDSIFPSQSGLAWKKNIILSTMNGMNHFYELVKGARNKTNGFKILEVDWRDVPRFNSDGSLKNPEQFMNEIVRKHGIVYFNQNYANEAIGSSYTLISSEKLKAMHSSEIHERRDGKLNIYHYPEEKHKYIMAIDASKGGNDAFAVQVVDITNFYFKQVASAKLQIDYLLMPEFIDEWCSFYNNAYLIIENNEGAGQSIADQMYQSYEYENLHFDTKTDINSKNKVKSRKGYPGFRTTPKTRKQILQTLKLFIENDKLQINDSSTINEFFQFILINNKYQADEGAHDDMVMALALIFVPFCNCRNFEDMKLLVSSLYSKDITNEEYTGMADLMTIASFDSATDENMESYEKQKYYSNI